MDDEPQFAPEFAAESSVDNHRPFPHVYTSTFFSKSKDFGISGGNFTNVIEAAPSDPLWAGISRTLSTLILVPHLTFE
ncbi:hypothetical protein B0H19DRAFT_1275086 [Mycena capillaripes]|nr:hypothetical protein B0H19DRAFT_1275086 [Mycena capillaripes]